MNAYDYLAGMTQSEAIHYIQNLPGLSRKEYDELMSAAENKPKRRYLTIDSEVNNTSKLRIESVVRFIRRRGQATYREVMEYLGWKGSTLYCALRNAEALGYIVSSMNSRREKVYRPRKA